MAIGTDKGGIFENRKKGFEKGGAITRGGRCDGE